MLQLRKNVLATIEILFEKNFHLAALIWMGKTDTQPLSEKTEEVNNLVLKEQENSILFIPNNLEPESLDKMLLAVAAHYAVVKFQFFPPEDLEKDLEEIKEYLRDETIHAFERFRKKFLTQGTLRPAIEE